MIAVDVDSLFMRLFKTTKGTRVLKSHWLKDQRFKDSFYQRSGTDDFRHEK